MPAMRSALSLAVAVFSGASSGFIRARAMKMSSVEKSAKAKVEIYFETLCPDCHELFDNSFRQIWGAKDFKERIDVDLIPFGNAMVIKQDTISEGYKFFHPTAKYPAIICQHYEAECLGNEILTCVGHLHGVDKAVDLNLCMVGKAVKRQGIEMSSYDCMTELGISHDEVKGCVGSDENIQRMIALGTRTFNPDLHRKYVPWVMVDGQHVEMDDDSSHDLITPLCNILTPPLPALCSGSKVGLPAVSNATRGSSP